MPSAIKPTRQTKQQTDALVGWHLQAILDRANVSRADLARVLEVDTATISAYCAGRRRMKLDTITRIAACLSVPVVTLFGWQGDATPLVH